MPDCKEFGDTEQCNTLRNVCAFNKGLDVPVLEALGLGNIQNFEGIEKTSTPLGQYGTLQEKSKGKRYNYRSLEIAGLVSEKTFCYISNGFPKELIDKFVCRNKMRRYISKYPG